MTYSERCDEVSEDQCKVVEQETKGQASWRMWCTYRWGRITVSNFSAVIKSNDNQPPKSLVRVIRSPESATVTTAATRCCLTF